MENWMWTTLVQRSVHRVASFKVPGKVTGRLESAVHGECKTYDYCWRGESLSFFPQF